MLSIAQTTMGLTRRRVDEVLDEPANGLDPAGIRWMRDLLRGYADRGATVLLSSHLLHEIEVVADDLVVIGHEHVVAAGTKDDLLAGASVATRHPASLAQALTSAGLVHHTNDTGCAAGTSTLAVFRVDADASMLATSRGRPGSPSPNSDLPTAPAWRRCS